MVVSVPLELNNDHEVLFALARGSGYFTERMLISAHGWTPERFTRIVNPLLQEGIVWIDDFNGNFIPSRRT